MAFDSMKQRRILGHFTTGVTVVTTDGPAGSHGMTANAFASLSLDPPLVLVAVDRRASMLEFLEQNGCFAVNILRDDQEPLSLRFATPGPKGFSDLDVTTAATGSPVLLDALAFLDCRVHSILPGGDHAIFVGEILAGDDRGGRPLVYYGGNYRNLAE